MHDLDEAVLQQAVDAYRAADKNKAAAGKAIGVSREVLRYRLKIAGEKGLLLDEPPAMPGMRISQITSGPDGKPQTIQQKPERGEEFKIPAGHKIKGVSALIDEEGREIVKWVKTKEDDLDPRAVVEWLKSAFTDYTAHAAPVTAPIGFAKDLLTFIPCNDWHLGMFSWGKETGVNWDLKIAEDAIGSGVECVIARTPRSAEAIVLVGGDLLHADNKDNQTSKSKNVLDVDGRYQKVIDVATRLMARAVDAALLRHQHVTVRVLPGNHDEHSAVAVAYFLLAWYKHEPRVTVDVDPSYFFYFRFGQVLIGATHGHTIKIQQMPQIMAHRRAIDWGQTTFRYVHGFHLHHTSKFATEGGGVISEVHQAPIPQDAWHYGSGFLSGPSLQAITYHRELGERGRVIERLTAAMATPVQAMAA